MEFFSSTKATTRYEGHTSAGWTPAEVARVSHFPRAADRRHQGGAAGAWRARRLRRPSRRPRARRDPAARQRRRRRVPVVKAASRPSDLDDRGGASRRARRAAQL